MNRVRAHVPANMDVSTQANLLASFLGGKKLEFDPSRVPSRPVFNKHAPIKNLTFASNYYSTEVHIDLNAANTLENLFFCIRAPGQNLRAGQFYQYCDFPAVKMLARVEFYLNSYQNLIETYSTSSAYMQTFESLAADETWSQFVTDYMGSYQNSLVLGPTTGAVADSTWILPLPFSILPSKLSQIVTDIKAPATLFVKIYLNPLKTLMYTSANFSPVDFVRTVSQTSGASAQVASECYIFSQESNSSSSLQPGSNCSSGDMLQVAYEPNQFWYTQAYSKSAVPKSEYFYAGTGSLISELHLLPANPMYASGQAFYGNYSENALLNFLNACVYTYDTVINPNADIVLNLRTGLAINLPAGWAITFINSSTYLFNAINAAGDPIKVLFICVGVDWISLSEDVFFDLGAFVNNANSVPVFLLKNIFFYVKQTSLETITPTGLVTPGGNAGFVEGLYLTVGGTWAIYGFQQFDFVDEMSEAERIFLKISLGTPIVPTNNQVSALAKAKFVYISDPLYQFYDLDRTLRMGSSNLVTRYNDLTKYTDTITNYAWSDMFFLDWAAKNKFKTNNLSPMLAYLPSTTFTYNSKERRLGFLDCLSNTLEIQFDLGLFDAASNKEIDRRALVGTKASLDGLIQNVYGSTTIPYDFVYKALRFVGFGSNNIFTFIANQALVNQILATSSAEAREAFLRATSTSAAPSSLRQMQSQQKRVRMV